MYDIYLYIYNVLQSGESTIHVAVRYGHVDVIEYLSSSGANVNLQDKVYYFIIPLYQ